MRGFSLLVLLVSRASEICGMEVRLKSRLLSFREENVAGGYRYGCGREDAMYEKSIASIKKPKNDDQSTT
jgi:hypothetical protein